MPSAQQPLLDSTATSPSLLVLQHDLSISCAPILRQVVEDALASQVQVVFVSLWLPPYKYLGKQSSLLLHLCDISDFVPGYSDKVPDVLAELQGKLPSAQKGPTTVVIDSPDTLLSNLGSQSRTLDILARAFGHTAHQSNSRLVLPIRSNSPLLEPLLSTTFRPRAAASGDSQPTTLHTLTHITLHPVTLFTHIIQNYHVSLPSPDTPPDTASARFWSVFLPVARRGTGEQLILGDEPDQPSTTPHSYHQMASRDARTGIVEIVTRARAGGQKGVRRVLRGWRTDSDKNMVCWCSWDEIAGLRLCLTEKSEVLGSAANAIDSVSFNLQLSDAQHEARAKVPLPYVNDGLHAYGASLDGEIHYVPDQADDFDDDDPDDDLYI
ncbi:hypothetical protein RhiJN_13409 [Ceratobasidium sp. AG-Ba]|nr:hypothetical protein RhiJN_13409 [Ceratobasidium sp. AG-Ba]QRW13965.1 hypothetical protein RhiLY_12964 [Ceratobasidium sp. AG-Ba]